MAAALVPAIGIVVFVFTSLAVFAAPVLFPSPLHVTRELTNPVTNGKSVIDEYCHGNRVVSVGGHKTAIADYDKGELTIIDFAAGTYSVTKFEAIAKVNERGATPVKAAANASQWKVQRQGNAVEARRDERTIRVTPDPQHTLSRAALEALTGTAYPNRRDEGEEAVLGALRVDTGRVAANGANAPEGEYHLPLEHVMRVEIGPDVMETRNVVTRVGTELPPPDLLVVPPGAKLVESPIVAAQRALDELDHPPAANH